MILIILADSSLELVPPSIISNRIIQSYSKKRKKSPEQIILDANYHWKPIQKLKNHEKRGRPDIVYRALLSIFDSPLYKCNMVNVIVHTIQNQVLYFKENIRLPRHYDRFIGLMEQVLYRGKAPLNGAPLIWSNSLSLSNLVKMKINELSAIPFIMTSKGKLCTPSQFHNLISLQKNLIFIIGGFPHGSFKLNLPNIKLQKISVFKEPLSTQAVCNYVLYSTALFTSKFENSCF